MKRDRQSILVIVSLFFTASLVAGIYFAAQQSGPAPLVEIQPQLQVQPKAAMTQSIKTDDTKPIARPSLSTSAPTGRYNTQPQQHDHDHDHTHDHSLQIPVEIQAYIDKQRIPQSELQPQRNQQGNLSLDPKGQFETVSIAVLGEDGEVRITERQIQPLAEPQKP